MFLFSLLFREKSIKVEVKAPSTTDDVVAGLEDSAKLVIYFLSFYF